MGGSHAGSDSCCNLTGTENVCKTSIKLDCLHTAGLRLRAAQARLFCVFTTSGKRLKQDEHVKETVRSNR